GDVGLPFVQRLGEVKHAVIIAIVYRGDVSGSVKATRNGRPRMRLWVPEKTVAPIMRGMKTAADALLRVGARYVHTGIQGAVSEMRTEADTSTLLARRIPAKHLAM